MLTLQNVYTLYCTYVPLYALAFVFCIKLLFSYLLTCKIQNVGYKNHSARNDSRMQIFHRYHQQQQLRIGVDCACSPVITALLGCGRWQSLKFD